MDNDFNENMEIDSLVNLLKMACAFENWEKLISLSDILLGYSFLMKGTAFQKLKQFPQSLECISHYADLSWLDDATEEASLVIGDFKFFAVANTLTIEILIGNKEKVTEYIDFLLKNPDHALSGLLSLLESAIVNNYNFDEEISLLLPHIYEFSIYHEQVLASKFLTFRYMLALYNCINSNFSTSIDNTLQNMFYSDKLYNDRHFKKSVGLFEVLKPRATVLQLADYSNMLITIYKGEMENEKEFSLNHHLIGSILNH